MTAIYRQVQEVQHKNAVEMKMVRPACAVFVVENKMEPSSLYWLYF